MSETTAAAPNVQELKIHSEDHYKLMQLALDARIKRKKMELAHLEYEAAETLSSMAGDITAAQLGVPPDAEEVTLDINAGVIKYKLPAE